MKEMVGGCCVCSDERGWSENPLVYCDGHGCNVAVHQACYGIVSVPTGPWFCRKCESQERAARVGASARKSQKPAKLTEQVLTTQDQAPTRGSVRCELCPQKDGALKRTDTGGGWCHVVCALFVPEAWFGNVQTMEPIILKGVPLERFNKSCYICEEQDRETKAQTGACMQCNKNGCKQHFHVTCAQAQGLLCEEQGNYMDNVKYCGYCSLHYKKLQKRDSHIKIIPAFKPIPADNATPDGTPEKSSSARQDRRRERPSKTCQLSSNMLPSGGQLSMMSSKGSPGHMSSTSPAGAGAGKESVTDIKSTGKFTTANFRETTITPSPANFGDFSSPGSSSSAGGGGSTPTHEKERKENKKSLSNDKGKGHETLSPDVYDSEYLDIDKRKIPGILGSPSGRSVAAAKESKFSVYPLLSSNEKQPKSGQSTPSRTPSRGEAQTPPSAVLAPTTGGAANNVTASLSTSTASMVATTVTMTTASSTPATSTTSSSQSNFSYSFENFLSSRNYANVDKTPSEKEVEVPTVKRPRSRSTDKAEKKKSKKNKGDKGAPEEPSVALSTPVTPLAPAVPSGTLTGMLALNSKAKTVKDLLAVTTAPSPMSQSPSTATQSGTSGGSHPPSARSLLHTGGHHSGSSHHGTVGRPRKPGKRKKTSSESSTLTGMPTLQPQGTFDSNPFGAPAAGTTPLILSSLTKQDKGDGPPILSQQPPIIPPGGSTSVQTPPLSGSAPAPTAPPTPGPSQSSTSSALFSESLGLPSRVSAHASTATVTNDSKDLFAGATPDLTDGLTNGPSNLIGPPRPPSSSSKSLMSPGRTSDSHAQLPTSMEQLLERQWDQGSQFLMEQGQHFDIASLLNCLHQLRQENQRLEEHINNLTVRRDQLLAVNARLSLPLTPLNALHLGSSLGGGGSQGTSPEGSTSHMRSPRMNSYGALEHPNTSATQEILSGLSGRSVPRSPAHSQAPPPSRSPAHSQAPPTSRSPAHSQIQPHSSTTPTHNHLPSHNASPALPSSSNFPPHSSPEGGPGGPGIHVPPSSMGGNPPGITDISPGGAAPPPPHQVTDQQRQMMLHQQQQQLLLAAPLTPEQRQHLMYQMAVSQQMPPGLLAPLPSTASTTTTLSTHQRSAPPNAHPTPSSQNAKTEKPKDKS